MTTAMEMEACVDAVVSLQEAAAAVSYSPILVLIALLVLVCCLLAADPG
jgi:hypothetical protein